jgi:hypothetical protein
MNRLLLTSMAALLMVSGARAARVASSYAVISLVGDQLDVVTYQPQVGSQLDNNSHMRLVLSQDELDTAALRAINRSLRAALPEAQVTLLAASTPDSFANQDQLFNGDHVALPAEIDAAVHREGAAMLVLVTKHRGEARLHLYNGFVGSGRLEGLGYYLDSDKHLKDIDTGVRSVGYLAPYVYVDVNLIDVATGKLLNRATIATGQVIGTSNGATAVHPWDALTSEEKLSRLKEMLASELEKTMPALLGAETPKATQ